MTENNIENVLTDEQVDVIAKELDEAVIGTTVEEIQKYPSNNGVETTDPETREAGESKVMMVRVDPNTGEQQIIPDNSESSLDDDESFEDMIARVETESSFESTIQDPFTIEEIKKNVENSKKDGTLSTLSDIELSDKSIRDLLIITNKVQNGEQFNIFKSFPEEIQNIINGYITEQGIALYSQEGKTFRNFISESLIQEFITNISIERTQNDLNKEIESIFNSCTTELANSVVGYTEERNKAYRKYADELEDPEKKEKILSILDVIDEAYKLDKLKEFAKNCKIKKFDLEKPKRYYEAFLLKYKDSPYNIYNIDLAKPILFRNLNSGDEQFVDKDIDAFFICFCKYCLNMNPNKVLEHAFMYYTIYNIVIIDMNKGESKQVSDKFTDNIKEVIYNLRTRNNY